MEADATAELKEAIERILQSPSRKKLVVAGPGTGKTTLFRALLEAASGDRKTRLVVTFINNLKNDLQKGLSDLEAAKSGVRSCNATLADINILLCRGL